MASLDQLHLAARHAIVKEDIRQSKGKYFNPNALGLKLEALGKAHDHAKDAVAAGKDPHEAFKEGVSKHFIDRTHDNIQKAVDKHIAGEKPKESGLKTWAKDTSKKEATTAAKAATKEARLATIHADSHRQLDMDFHERASKAAGAHEKAAQAHRDAGRESTAKEHEKAADRFREQAGSAKAYLQGAGQWEEDKHPRGEGGKFA